MFLTTSSTNVNDSTYLKIANVLTLIAKSGGIYMARGNCISASEMIRLALLSEGINSSVVECTLSLRIKDSSGDESISPIGFNGVSNPGEIDTHMVVVTDTPTPYLIDASISHRLPESVPIVFQAIDKTDTNLLYLHTMDPQRNELNLIYTEKKHQKATNAYQMSIIDRITTDAKIFREIEYLKKLNYIAIAASVFSIINTALNMVMLYK